MTLLSLSLLLWLSLLSLWLLLLLQTWIHHLYINTVYIIHLICHNHFGYESIQSQKRNWHLVCWNIQIDKYFFLGETNKQTKKCCKQYLKIFMANINLLQVKILITFSKKLVSLIIIIFWEFFSLINKIFCFCYNQTKRKRCWSCKT